MNTERNGMKFNVSRGQRLMLLVCVTVLCMIVGAVLVAIVNSTEPTTPRLRIGAVIQDIVIFMAPALITAVMATRRPADLLCLYRPKISVTITGMLALLVSIPAMNMIISWNESLPMPEYFSAAEAQAAESIKLLIGSGDVSGLVATILIVGLLAPLCEELFFRGCLQRVLTTSGMNIHAAIWTAAIIFSAFHMQMAGFVPRMLLGALFGYVMVWSGSVWGAVSLHMLNNILASVTEWSALRGVSTGLDEAGSDSVMLATVSAALTACVLIVCYKNRVSGRREPVNRTSYDGK